MVRSAIQLYSVRDIDEPLDEILRMAAAAGYKGVEFAKRIDDADQDAVKTALRETGLQAISAHVPFRRLEADPDGVMDQFEPLGCRSLVIPHLPASHFRTERRIRQLAERIVNVEEQLARRGFDLHYHNQYKELGIHERDSLFERLCTVADPYPPPTQGESTIGRVERLVGLVGDRLLQRVRSPHRADSIDQTPLARLLELMPDDTLAIEVDVGNASVAGLAPDAFIEALGERTRIVHIKDGIIERVGPDGADRSVPLGDGDVDLSTALTSAKRNGVEWVVHENDDPERPEAVLERGPDRLLAPKQPI